MGGQELGNSFLLIAPHRFQVGYELVGETFLIAQQQSRRGRCVCRITTHESIQHDTNGQPMVLLPSFRVTPIGVE